MRVLIALLILFGTAAGYLVSINHWKAKVDQTAIAAGYDISTVEGLTQAAMDEKIRSIPNHSTLVLMTGLGAFAIFLAISMGSRRQIR